MSAVAEIVSLEYTWRLSYSARWMRVSSVFTESHGTMKPPAFICPTIEPLGPYTMPTRPAPIGW